MVIIDRTSPVDTERGIKVFKWAYDSFSESEEKAFEERLDAASNLAEAGRTKEAISILRLLITKYENNALPAYRRLGFLLPEGKSRIELLEPVFSFIETRLKNAGANRKDCKFPSFVENKWFFDILHLLAHSFFLDNQTKKGIQLYEMMRGFTDGYDSKGCDEILAWKYIEIGNYSKAIARSRSAFKDDEPLVELLYAFGLASILKGDEKNGFPALRRAYEIFPLYGQIISQQSPAKMLSYLETGKKIESFGLYNLDHALSFLSSSHHGWLSLWTPDGRFPTPYGEKVFGLFTVGDTVFAKV